VKLGWVLIICCAATPAWGQTGTAALTGLVQGADRKPKLGGVVVTATSRALQGEQSAVTDAAGVYRIPNLPPGVYTLRFSREGYQPSTRKGFGLRADITVRVNAILFPLEPTEAPVAARDDEPDRTVAAEASETAAASGTNAVDVGSSSTGANLNAEFIKRIPISAPGGKGAAARSIESVAVAGPNTIADRFGTSISGTTSPENRYLLDGLAVNSPGFAILGTPLSSEFVREINVVTAGYMPEYGRTTGGVLNVVTKSGSNEFHGSIWSFASPGGLEGRRKPVSVSGQTVQFAPRLSLIGDVGGDLGGPIVKDRLWFYAGFDVSSTRYNIDRDLYATDAGGNVSSGAIPGASRTFPAILQTVQAMAKLTFQPNADNRLTVSVYGVPATSGEDGQYAVNPSSGAPEIGSGSTPGLYAATASRRQSRPFDGLVKWTSQFLDKRLVFDAMLGVHHQSDSALAADGSAAGSKSGYASFPGVLWQRAPAHPVTDFEPVPGGGCAPPAQCPVTGYYTGGYDKGVSARLATETHDRLHGSLIATFFFAGLGHHVVKAGFETELTRFQNLKSFWLMQESADGTTFSDAFHFGILVGPDQPHYLNPIAVETSSMTVGGFVQDSWSVLDAVTVNLGVRYDAQYLYTGDNLALSLPNQWSPRLGVIYDPGQAGRSKIFASYARYFENAPLSLADTALNGEPHALRTLDATRCPDPGDPRYQEACAAPAAIVARGGPENPNRLYGAIGQGGAPVDPDIQAASTDEIVAGTELEPFPEARFGVTYTRRWVHRWIEDISRDNMNTFFLANPGYGIAADFPRARRNYDALTLYLVKVFANDWLAQASYTLGYLRGNMVAFFRPETGDLLPNYSSDWDTKELMDTRDGPLAGDNRHTLKLFAARDWALGRTQRLGTGVALRAVSGAPTNYIGNPPFHGPREQYVLPRGSGKRLPASFGADLQLAYRVGVSAGVNVSVVMDVFNVFNLQGVTATDEVYTTSTVNGIKGGKPADLASLRDLSGAPAPMKIGFGEPIAYQEPRVFRFGVRGEF
jgi:hypothetical protein